MNTDRPLDRISAIRTKLAVLVGASFLAAILVSEMGSRAGVSGWVTVPMTLAAALAVTHWLSTGLTQPLRDLTEAAGRMARGDYSTRITELRPDETGQLGSAFNDMAEQLATHDRQRRELIATVSHEIRTPLTAQRALLENLVDGVLAGVRGATRGLGHGGVAAGRPRDHVCRGRADRAHCGGRRGTVGASGGQPARQRRPP